MYLRTLGSEQELGWAFLAHALKFPRLNLQPFKLPPAPHFPSVPPAPRIPSPPRITAPRIPSPPLMPKVPAMPKIDVSKISKNFMAPTNAVVKEIQRGGKNLTRSISTAIKSTEKMFSQMSPSEQENLYNEPENEDQTDYTEDSSNMIFNPEPEPIEEPTMLSPQESEEMLGALTQGQSGMLNTGLSIASSFIPGGSLFMPAASQLIQSQTKKPKQKPNLLSLLQKKPVAKPIQKSTAKPTQRSIAPEKKSDNSILIIGGIAVLVLLMGSKKKR